MERQQCNSLQNFDESKSEILKKRLLKTNSAATTTLAQGSIQQNALLSGLRTAPNNMMMSSVPAPQSSIPITHNLVTHSIAPVKIHGNNTYPLQLSTVHVPVQIPGSTSNINVPVQLSTSSNTMPLQITPVSLPLQVSGTTNVPVQLPAGETINVPLQIPGTNQNIQHLAQSMQSMPLLQNTSQPLHSSIIHVHMGSNPQSANLDSSSEIVVSSSSQLSDSQSLHMKMNNPGTQVQVTSNPTVVQIPSSSNNSIQLTLPNSCGSAPVQIRGATRTMPHVVYIQTPTGLKPVSSSEVINQATTSGNPPQIIVRRPVTSNPNVQVIGKANLAPKIAKSSLLTSANAAQPIVIQKPKSKEKVIVPVSLAAANQGKPIAYLGPVKKANTKPLTENQSILISNNQPSSNQNNQKLFLTPMTMPKIQNTKFILPVNLSNTMASKGPIINLQISNGQIQNDPQGNITVLRDTVSMDSTEIPPLQPLGKASTNGSDSVPQSPNAEKSFPMAIPGSRAEPTGEQGEYTLSIPETNASMNDDIYTLSIADDEGGHVREKSFTISIPEKGKSLLNKNVIEKDVTPLTIPAPAILKRSYSDNSEKKPVVNINLKRRISLCNENYVTGKNMRLNPPTSQYSQISLQKMVLPEIVNNDDHRVPSLFCDEKLDKDLENKINMMDSEAEDDQVFKNKSVERKSAKIISKDDFTQRESVDKDKLKRKSIEYTLEEDPPGLLWNNGIATLQGSILQFQTNEFGLIDLIDNSDHEDLLVTPNAKYHTPLKQRIERSGREKKPTSPEDMYRCDGCGCHGMAAEFITPNFCSVTCQNEVQKLNQKKKERERIELIKKRNKMKKLLMKKHISDTDILQEKEDTVLKHCNSTPADTEEEFVENKKYPWMCGKNGFSWMRYLDICKAKAAPVKFFKDPFPYNRNGFKVGMRLEAIDPQHPSIFAVVSVAEVQGYRMRIHFDGYPDVHDFWVNADSIDIFPAGWCEKNGRNLKCPPHYNMGIGFSWPMYLKQVRAITAPRHLFPHTTTTMIMPNGFRIGMKLEAEDRKNDLVCVATIADMLDNRMLIHFDSWDEIYDIWVDPTSPYIHPVGWAEENDVDLTPPTFQKKSRPFSWESYLAETESTAAPQRAFKTRPPLGFKPGMKLEVVDARVPFLIRVASVKAVKGHQVQIGYDGWPDELAVWMDDDSPDMHPVGWCLKTGHPLEPPLTEEELRISGPCGVGGCRGLGSLRGGSYKQHGAASACPYRPKSPPSPEDRLAAERPTSKQTNSIHTSTSTPVSDRPKERRGRPPKHKRLEDVKNDEDSDEESIKSEGSKRWCAKTQDTQQSEEPADKEEKVKEEEPMGPRAPRVALYVEELALGQDVLRWSQSDVAALLTRVAGPTVGIAALEARLTGAELLMASCEELVTGLKIRLGPAVKVYGAVRQLRESLT